MLSEYVHLAQSATGRALTAADLRAIDAFDATTAGIVDTVESFIEFGPDKGEPVAEAATAVVRALGDYRTALDSLDADMRDGAGQQTPAVAAMLGLLASRLAKLANRTHQAIVTALIGQPAGELLPRDGAYALSNGYVQVDETAAG